MWNKVKLGEVLCRVKDDITIEDNTSYKQITVRLNHKGVILRGLKNGIEIKSKQFIAKTGNLIISGIDARNGAVGIVPEELNGAVVTNDFLLYDCNNLKLSTEYIAELLKTEYFDNELKKASEGTTNRVRLQKDKFLAIEIPLPPLSEQLTIVAKLENATAKLKQIKQLRAESLTLQNSFFESILEKYKNQINNIRLEELIEYQNGFIEIDDLQSYKRCTAKLYAQGIELRDVVKGFDIKTKKQQVCKKHDFLVAEIDAKLGGFGIVPENLEGAIVSSHYFLFCAKTELLNIKYLENIIKTRNFQKQIIARGTTNYSAIRPKNILNIEIPYLSIAMQNKIVRLTDKLTQLTQLQQQTEAEITAMEKSILNTYKPIR
jgi:type I restriction enzyme S subunit